MKVTDNITLTINRLPKGYVFTYADFATEVNKKEAVIKALNRMVKAGKIAKLSKGRYYKPEIGPFGELLPDRKQIVKDLLEDNGKLIGYMTGYSVYNELGLTTQLSNIIQVGRNKVRSAFKRDRYTISFISQNNNISKENIPLLQILDSLRYIKKIPDTSVEKSCKRFLAIFSELSDEELTSLVRLSQKYSSATRALTGAILEEIGKLQYSEQLYKTLNPITKYVFKGASKALSNTQKWNIV